MLSVYYELMQKDFYSIEKELPKNKDVKEDEHKDLLIRELDCAVIQYLHQKIKEEIEQDNTTSLKEFDSVRGVFTEGGPAFPGAGVQKKVTYKYAFAIWTVLKDSFYLEIVVI